MGKERERERGKRLVGTRRAHNTFATRAAGDKSPRSQVQDDGHQQRSSSRAQRGATFPPARDDRYVYTATVVYLATEMQGEFSRFFSSFGFFYMIGEKSTFLNFEEEDTWTLFILFFFFIHLSRLILESQKMKNLLKVIQFFPAFVKFSSVFKLTFSTKFEELFRY